MCVSILSIYNYKGIIRCKSDFPEFNIHFLNFISIDNMLGAITVLKKSVMYTECQRFYICSFSRKLI